MTSSEGYVMTEDGLRLFYQRAGKGSQVVVIPNAAYMFDDFKWAADDHTVIFYDLRNRGRSDSVTDTSKLQGGIHNDIEDLEVIRRHFGVSPVAVMGHSYLGMVVALYAMKYPAHVSRVVMAGALPPEVGKQYPAHLTGADATMAETYSKLAELQKHSPSQDPQEFGAKMWAVMRQLYVTNPADAGKITWSVSHLPNESFLKVMKYYSDYLLPSAQSIKLTADDFAKVTVPVLVVHGTRDRHTPYGGARDWAVSLPNARLLTVENAAHLPWIEAPETVFQSIRTFLDGDWPDAAQPVKS